MKRFIFVGGILALSGCTAVQVKPVESSYQMSHVCIESNPKVLVEDFVTVMEDVFQDHGITTELYSGNVPDRCEYRLTYTAFRKWDFVPYLSHAEVRLFKGGQRIGYAEYHLNGGGGLALNKWASVESKMTPVINELLSQQR